MSDKVTLLLQLKQGSYVARPLSSKMCHQLLSQLLVAHLHQAV